MFETSVVHARSRALDRRHVLLTFSIAFHSAAIAAVIAASVASTHFPVHAPKEMRLPVLIPAISLPPALGTQHPAPPKPRQSAATRVPTAPRLEVAPLTIPQAPTIAEGAGESPVTTTGVGEGGPSGVPDGVSGGVCVDPAPTAPLPVTGDVKAPIVIRRVTPQYPQIAVRARRSGWVIVECIIDKSGNVTNVQVLKPLPFGLDQAAAEAVKKWKFRPGTLNGTPVDVIFNLTVNFKLN